VEAPRIALERRVEVLEGCVKDLLQVLWQVGTQTGGGVGDPKEVDSLSTESRSRLKGVAIQVNVRLHGM
jgi:hypothetical protein